MIGLGSDNKQKKSTGGCWDVLLEAELGSTGDRGAQVWGGRDMDQPQEQTGNDDDDDDDNDPQINPKMIGWLWFS